jgi:glycosyltransferase involved in cell wall biosynthesis
MLISIVIPAHNEEKYIGKCLKSLLTQNFRDFEIVVCLNACSDGTEEVVKKFPISNFQFPISIFKENKKGVVFARQTGTVAAQGEIIVCADADTIYPKDWLSKIAGEFQENPEIAGIYGPVYLYDGPFYIRLADKIFYLPFLYLSKLFGHDNPAGMNFAFKKEIFDKIGGYDINLKSAEDVELGCRLKKYGKLKITPTLKVYSSARRFRRGTLKFFTHHIKNYFRFFIFKKPPRDFEDVR